MALPPDWVVGLNGQQIDGHLMPGIWVGGTWVLVRHLSSCCLRAAAIPFPGDLGALTTFPSGAACWGHFSRFLVEDS